MDLIEKQIHTVYIHDHFKWDPGSDNLIGPFDLNFKPIQCLATLTSHRQRVHFRLDYFFCFFSLCCLLVWDSEICEIAISDHSPISVVLDDLQPERNARQPIMRTSATLLVVQEVNMNSLTAAIYQS